MRRLLYLAALSMLVVALSASVALGQSRGPSGADGTFNCSDFDDQGQAQEFFNNAGPGDPNGLDADSDGQACESLPTVVADGTPDGAAIPGQGESTPAAAPEDDVDCADFVSFAGNPSQFQAQQFFDANNPAQDPFNLDADGDGIACEGLEGGAPEDEAADDDMAAVQQPTPTPETGQPTARRRGGGSRRGARSRWSAGSAASELETVT